MLPVCRVCTYSMLYSSTTDFILLLLIVIYDFVGTYDETIIMDWYVGQ